MELSLFGQEYRSKSFVDCLKSICELSDSDLQAFIQMLVEVSAEKEVDDEAAQKIKRILSTDDDDKARRTTFTVLSSLLRMLSGRVSDEIQQDLIDNGFREEGVRRLFSLIAGLPEADRVCIRTWAAEVETSRNRNHIHTSSIVPNVMFITDGGSTVCTVPIAAIRMDVWSKERTRASVWRLELTHDELEFLIGVLRSALTELETSTKDLKKRLGDVFIDTTG
jgi:hypothetical protein